MATSFIAGSPYPRRSSLLPTSTLQPEKHFEACHLLSPVAPIKSGPLVSGGGPVDRLLRGGVGSGVGANNNNSNSQQQHVVQGFRDALGDHVTLCYPADRYYRISLPRIASCSFVKRCLATLRQVLPRDLAMLVMTKWYAVRNAPGSQNISMTEEWELFQDLLLKLLGYDTSTLPLSIGSKSARKSAHDAAANPEPKKPKTSYEPTDADWRHLVTSRRHAELARTLANVYGIVDSSKQNIANKIDTIDTTSTSTSKINTDASLFQTLPVILFALHLLYEDLKLNGVYSDYRKRLALFLHQLASDLRLDGYVRHYWMDFPDECCLRHRVDDDDNDVTVSQMCDADRAKLLQQHCPSYARFGGGENSGQKQQQEEVVDIFKFIYDVLLNSSNNRSSCGDVAASGEQLKTYPCLSRVNRLSKIMVQLANLLARPTKITNDYDLDDCIERIPSSRRCNESTSQQQQQSQQSSWQHGDKRQRHNHHQRADVSAASMMKRIYNNAADIDTDMECCEPTEAGEARDAAASVAERAVLFLTSMGVTRRMIGQLPPTVALMCQWAMEPCREHPPTDWRADAYALLLRHDLITDHVQRESEIHCETSLSQQRHLGGDAGNVLCTECSDTEDGMENIETQLLRLRFPKDLRVGEVRRLLHSATPVTIDIAQSPDVSDHEFIEEQEKQLYSVTTRTMALPVGRGMFTLRSMSACTTEPLPIPKLCLTGKVPPRGVTVELTHIEVPAQMNLWPSFHNGAAAGLRLRPALPQSTSHTAPHRGGTSGGAGGGACSVDSAWIVYNRPSPAAAAAAGRTSSQQDAPAEHAGLLMALGLNGYLKSLSYMSVYEYLVKCNEMTSVGLLLGISATHRGTMDLSTTKLLSIHLEALLPPTSIELDIPQTIQVAALLGVGLVYQGTGNRHMAEVLLSEIGRPPGPEMENSVERESYSLAAGLALGLVTLAQGGGGGDGSADHAPTTALTDLAIPDTLHYYMLGGNKRPLTGAQKDKYKLASFQIREGDSVNIDVTAPGATLALGLMFFATGNKTIADWMKPAETHYMLDFVRPDLLLLRTISRGLILWHDIRPAESWVEDQVPVVFRKYCLCTPDPDYQIDVDYEGINQAYCNILAGACFCIGLKYAGSGDQRAYELLLKYTQRFMRLGGRNIADLAGKSTIETCMNLILISLAMVMCGTGDLMTLRICRLLRARVGVAGTATATYGSHLATHMAAGLLLLGAGRYTLSTSPEAVAAMVCAFFPKFPTHSNDNRYHLQAFRHLYVLAAEPRILIPRDLDSGLLCYSNVTVVYAEDPVVEERLKAPCFLPELHRLKSVRIEDDRYWPVVFEADRNWDQLKDLLADCYCLDIKQRAGCLSYEEDPEGFKTLLAQTLTTDVSNVWSAQSDNIFSFSSEPAVLNFTQQFLSSAECDGAATSGGGSSKGKGEDKSSECEKSLVQRISMQAYECVTRDMVHVLPQRVTLSMALQNFERNPSVFTVWQMKLLARLVEVCTSQTNDSRSKLISHENVLSMSQFISKMFDTWETELRPLIAEYQNSTTNVSRVPSNLVHKLVSYLTYYDVPCIKNLEISDASFNPIKILMCNRDKTNVNTLLKMMHSTKLTM